VILQAPFQPPPILDGDIAWACDALGLPRTAFSGTDSSDPRQAVLQSVADLDIEACPGSGKTTLLVAKLAILSRNWKESTRGICVLSHTNVARREIEQRLGNTEAGQHLLRYPHFVGTIHGFINEFLALPWLRSNEAAVRMIDDEIALSRRWRRLSWSTRAFLEKKHLDHGALKMKSPDLELGDLGFGRDTPTYRALLKACHDTAAEGFWCHEEMFLIASDLLERSPEVAELTRYRFPMLFIDEVQDNSEMQSALLHKLFRNGSGPVLRQRYGDSNQAIYRHQAEQEGATTDKFPDSSVRADIPNSHRFGVKIASLADPFGVVPQDLVGGGPAGKISAVTGDKHAILLFDDVSIKDVLLVYSRYLREIFTTDDLKNGVFTAVGAVHRATKDDQVPRHVGHYWVEYDPELVASEPKPQTYCQYLMAGLKRAEESGESYPLTEFLAEGIFALARRADPLVDIANRQRKHRYLMQLLADKPEARAGYADLVTTIAADCTLPTPAEWQRKWMDQIRRISEAIIGKQINSVTATDFLRWEKTSPTELRRRDNRFRETTETPEVEIRLGSIHSVKGETHTATLVCETYFKTHHLTALKPWLLGKKVGGEKESETMKSRLRQHYVALTRPTHLLCLAMRANSFSDGEIEKLKARGWRVGRVGSGNVSWL